MCLVIIFIRKSWVFSLSWSSSSSLSLSQSTEEESGVKERDFVDLKRRGYGLKLGWVGLFLSGHCNIIAVSWSLWVSKVSSVLCLDGVLPSSPSSWWMILRWGEDDDEVLLCWADWLIKINKNNNCNCPVQEERESLGFDFLTTWMMILILIWCGRCGVAMMKDDDKCLAATIWS